LDPTLTTLTDGRTNGTRDDEHGWMDGRDDDIVVSFEHASDAGRGGVGVVAWAVV
jgi:hypothetical protein